MLLIVYKYKNKLLGSIHHQSLKHTFISSTATEAVSTMPWFSNGFLLFSCSKGLVEGGTGGGGGVGVTVIDLACEILRIKARR